MGPAKVKIWIQNGVVGLTEKSVEVKALNFNLCIADVYLLLRPN